MKQELSDYRYDDGAVQRIQKVTLDGFDELKFMKPVASVECFRRMHRLYEDYIIPRYSAVLGYIVLFYLPDDMEVSFNTDDESYGHVCDPLSVVTLALRKHVKVRKGKIYIDDEKTRVFFEALKDRGALYVSKGRRNSVSILPVSDRMGFLSESQRDSGFRVNSSFFVMNKTDCNTIHDHIGIPVGMCVKDGRIMSPALFEREALLVQGDKTVKVRQVSLKQMKVIIDGRCYEDGRNAFFMSRPGYARTPSGGFDIVICDHRIMSYKKGGRSPVPSCGFVMHLEEEIKIDDLKVTYEGMEDVIFGIQAGNSAIINGKKTDRFISRFHDLKNPFSTPYVPTLYPLNYRKDRAPRIVIGSDEENRPVILWIEGAGKFGYVSGKDSAGASLSEVADICEHLGLRNAVNMDGGGSAQILYEGKRYLKVSDRDPEDLSEIERGIAAGLYV